MKLPEQKKNTIDTLLLSSVIVQQCSRPKLPMEYGGNEYDSTLWIWHSRP